jgi:fumarylacetoacetate (FAA) hydrolase
MKLATLANGTRDGRLVVVSRDLAYATDARGIADTLQDALDDWARLAPKLETLAVVLETGAVPRERFREHEALSPLPRAYQWIDGSAYLSHVELVRKARGAAMPPDLWTDPLLYQGGSDSFLSPREPIKMPDDGLGIDFEGEVAVIVNDVPMGASGAEAAAAIVLIVLVNDVSLRNLIPAELAKGFGFLQSKPSSAFSPVAVTPDELGQAWDGGRLHLPLLVSLNGRPFGRANAGTGMHFDFPALIAHAARTRPLAAGTLIGSGTVSNKEADGGPGRPATAGGVGFSCLIEARMAEAMREGAPKTQFLRFGDTVRIEVKTPAGQSVFGAIEQTVEPYARPSA